MKIKEYSTNKIAVYIREYRKRAYVIEKKRKDDIEYRKKNRGMLRKKNNEYYHNNKQKVLKRTNEYYWKNKEKINKRNKEYCRKYREQPEIRKHNEEYRNKPEIKERMKNYRLNNKEKVLNYCRKQYNKRRKLGNMELFKNPFDESEQIDWHHILVKTTETIYNML
jgi:hypothetical protein